MNKVILMGRMTADPKVVYLDSGTCQAGFILAVDRRLKKDGDNQTADFIRCICWNKTAEFVEKYGRKGVKFVVEGHIQTGSYTNKDGNKVYTTDVVVENLEFAESKKTDAAGSQPSLVDTGDGFMNVDYGIEENLPFN